MINKISRGSEWRKWDLHFHTPSSYDYKDETVTNQQIIEGLSQNEISVIAITDHHVIDVKRIKELQLLGKEKSITVLPGIEFLSDAKGKEPIHFIGIFSETCNIDFIWKQIESKTNIKRIESEDKHPNQVYCDLTDTIALIKELGGVVSIHAGDKSNSIDNITHSLPHGTAQKEDIAKVIDIFEIGKESDVQEYQKHVIPYCINTINKNIPMIICSDNHNINEYKIKQNLWIKADPTFEGLKQIIYEPERAKIQKEKPDYKEDKLVIDYVQFIDSTNYFTPAPIYLNSNLNVIIGGKSSGKSILLYNIAKTLYPDNTFFENENLQDKYKEICKNDTSDFKVTLNGGFSQHLYNPRNENSILPDIKYIPQNYLIKLAEPEVNKRNNDIRKLIIALIKEDRESKAIHDGFLEKLRKNDDKRKNLIGNYFEIIDKISFLQDELKLKTREEILKQNIENNTEKIEEYNKNSGFTDEQIIIYKEIQEELDNQNEYLQKLINDKEKINKLQQKNIEILKELFIINEQIITSLEVDSLRENLIKQQEKMEETIENLEKALKKILNDEQFLEKEIVQTENQIKDKKIQILNFTEKQQIKTLVDTLKNSISEDRRQLNEIQKLNKEIDTNKIELINIKKALLAFYENNYFEYPKVIEQLYNRIDALKRDNLIIQGITRFNFRKFRKAMLEISDGRSASYDNYPELFAETLTALTEYNIEDLKIAIEKVFDAVINKKYSLTPKTDIKKATEILFGHYFFDDWDVEYLGDKLRHMSSGKASFVILMLIIGLSKSKAPILIDQPEDNLDNRSITSDLVKYLKEKKTERQIILVTHNPNVVVNADAENIIVAHQKGQNNDIERGIYRFDYINGSLENTFPKNENEKDVLKSMGIREHIADIVEGSKEAFKKRQEKYGF